MTCPAQFVLPGHENRQAWIITGTELGNILRDAPGNQESSGELGRFSP